jgi:hypothetical protein
MGQPKSLMPPDWAALILSPRTFTITNIAQKERTVIAAMNEYLTRNEVAGRWGLHPGTLANWSVWGRGPKPIRSGRRIVYRRCDIERYEAEHDMSRD